MNTSSVELLKVLRANYWQEVYHTRCILPNSHSVRVKGDALVFNIILICSDHSVNVLVSYKAWQYRLLTIRSLQFCINQYNQAKDSKFLWLDYKLEVLLKLKPK